MYQCERSIAGQAGTAKEIIRVFGIPVLAFSFLAAVRRDSFPADRIDFDSKAATRWNADTSSALGRVFVPTALAVFGCSRCSTPKNRRTNANTTRQVENRCIRSGFC